MTQIWYNFLLIGTLTRRHSRRKSSNSTDDSSNSGTLKRQHSYKARGSVESMSGRGGNSTPLCSTPVREKASPFGERDKSSPFNERPPSANSVLSPVTANNLDMPSSMVSTYIKNDLNLFYTVVQLMNVLYISVPPLIYN